MVALGLEAQTPPPTLSTAPAVTVKASVQELLQGYLRWVERHPAAIPNTPASNSSLLQPVPPDDSDSAIHAKPMNAATLQPGGEDSKASSTLLVDVPAVDLYSPLGVSVYHGTDSSSNAAFIRALPTSIPQAKKGNTDELRPTLQEALALIPELAQYSAVRLPKHQYTLFALTFIDQARCKAQNEAIQGLKDRAQRAGIRVIEVQLHK